MVIHEKFEYLTEEERRLKDDTERKRYWKRWGPYVSERQWATGNAIVVLHPIVYSHRRVC